MICQTIAEEKAYLLVITETWHESSGAASLMDTTALMLLNLYAACPGTDTHTLSLRNHGGIAVIHRREIDLKSSSLDNFSTTMYENLCCVATVSGKRFLLFCVYLPGSEAVSSAFFDEITSVLERLVLLKYPIVLCGDFNIHMDIDADWATNRLRQLLESFDCTQHV